MLKIKKKKKVMILTGKHKNQIGIVSKIIKKKIKKNIKYFIILEGLNIVKKHTKTNPNKENSGGIIKKEAPIDISNVININPINNKKEKVKIKLENQKKIIIFKSNGEVLS